MDKISLKSTDKFQFIDITSQVKKIIQNRKITDGLCCIYTPHTTAGIMINENTDPDLKDDFIKFYQQIFPKNLKFKHWEGNAEAHILSNMTNCNQTLIVNQGKLILGTWQAIYFFEFDGPRTREVFIKTI